MWKDWELFCNCGSGSLNYLMKQNRHLRSQKLTLYPRLSVTSRATTTYEPWTSHLRHGYIYLLASYLTSLPFSCCIFSGYQNLQKWCKLLKLQRNNDMKKNWIYYVTSHHQTVEFREFFTLSESPSYRVDTDRKNFV